jgi:hypothetical protein
VLAALGVHADRTQDVVGAEDQAVEVDDQKIEVIEPPRCPG